MDAEELLRGLDTDQRNAVTCPETATVVHAGAGSGKTRVLTHRIAYRVATGSAHAERILAITFTREAASEMRRRLMDLGVSRESGESQSVTVGTFHAVALALLRQRLADIHKPMPSIIHNRLQLVTTAAENHPLVTRARELLVEVDWAHARLIPPATYAQTAKRLGRYAPAPHNEIATIYKRYEQLKLQRNVVDLDDLISRVVDAIRADNAYAQAVRWRYRHLFVDEAQDMNPLQYELFEAIRGQRADVFVVGDPMQAIYGWNGSDKRLFDDLPDKIRGTTVLRLPNNYRCSPQILAVATAVVQHAGHEIDVRSMRVGAEPVVARSFADAEAEVIGITSMLWSYAARGGAEPWKSSAVLVRTNIQIEPIVDALVASGIPVRTARPSPELSSAISDAAQSKNRNGLATWVTDVFSESESEIQRWVAEQLQTFLKLDHPGTVDGRAFSSWMRATAADQRSTDGVEVLTFHSAKGREWDCVVVAGAEVGLLPHASAINQEQKAEEVRLAYVALTRASKQLFITWAQTRKGRTSGRSELLSDLGDLSSAPNESLVTAPKRVPRVRVASLEDQLRTWRSGVARVVKQLPNAICSDYELRLIATQRPTKNEELAVIVGKITARRIGPDVLGIINQDNKPE
ncbi:MAG: UvrD-helicase domain-containing protein [Acidimicrobiaceae bacterium]|nr:UvrD-helicase domain-containing protein [Acidimicrobiaceae bacterium]